MKSNSFRKVGFTIQPTHVYGHYEIQAAYKGKTIKSITTDAEAYDWIDDDSNQEKHKEARRHCYNKIVTAYKAIYGYNE